MDLLLGLAKWPAALLAVLSLPALVQALHYLQLGNLRFFAFAGGAFLYLALKIIAAARSNISMQILAHELTHTFFALLTFHKVVHIHLNMDESGGAMGFKGKGNWLITIAPYFFPLFLFFMMLAVTFFSSKIPDSLMVNGVFGYFFAVSSGKYSGANSWGATGFSGGRFSVLLAVSAWGKFVCMFGSTGF